ncbi:hypothetical protein TrLO_g7402 [Triparma laevis f. longispina]|uniref:Uncharacterized protein n=1 Tax=Triparma laevis f. longispina TaxID=1714387 RepID=A0A9W7C304_9STRA|nr:hypothetical protein TrLO_g7402 [Triparma laevis f. longispina]
MPSSWVFPLQNCNIEGISIETFLPTEFFYVRQDSTPKAPVTSLIAWGLLVYLALGGAFGLLFLSEYTKETIVKETTIEALPITGNENIECKGLSTIKGESTTDYNLNSSPEPYYKPPPIDPSRSTDRFSFDWVRTGGYMLNDITEAQFKEATNGLCSEGLQKNLELRGKIACPPLPWSSDSDKRGICDYKAEGVSDLNDGDYFVYPSKGFDCYYSYTSVKVEGEWISAQSSVYFPQGLNSVASFVTFANGPDGRTSSKTTKWISTMAKSTDDAYPTDHRIVEEWGSTQMSSGGTCDGESYDPTGSTEQTIWYPTKLGDSVDSLTPANTLIFSFGYQDSYEIFGSSFDEFQIMPLDSQGNVDPSVITECQAEIDKVWDFLFVEQAPYACVETKKTSPTLTESLAYAYANLALFATFFVPLIAIFMQKISGGSSTRESVASTLGIELEGGAGRPPPPPGLRTGDVSAKNPVV